MPVISFRVFLLAMGVEIRWRGGHGSLGPGGGSGNLNAAPINMWQKQNGAKWKFMRQRSVAAERAHNSLPMSCYRISEL